MLRLFCLDIENFKSEAVLFGKIDHNKANAPVTKAVAILLPLEVFYRPEADVLVMFRPRAIRPLVPIVGIILGCVKMVLFSEQHVTCIIQ